MRAQTVDGVPVWEGGLNNRDIAFHTGVDVFTLVVFINHNRTVQTAEYQKLLRAAVKQATLPKEPATT